ncbi:unnamed protein product [Brachionus calyciflorus]|uniref:EGF-like domain-containing protein n=1 Tax=Brachionus calyciflorus TaxID=104777 RepID=A0A814E8E3_9BILA|nr:unnamed protein product [Brachionus calyciflorus]
MSLNFFDCLIVMVLMISTSLIVPVLNSKENSNDCFEKSIECKKECNNFENCLAYCFKNKRIYAIFSKIKPNCLCTNLKIKHCDKAKYYGLKSHKIYETKFALEKTTKKFITNTRPRTTTPKIYSNQTISPSGYFWPQVNWIVCPVEAYVGEITSLTIYYNQTDFVYLDIDNKLLNLSNPNQSTTIIYNYSFKQNGSHELIAYDSEFLTYARCEIEVVDLVNDYKLDGFFYLSDILISPTVLTLNIDFNNCLNNCSNNGICLINYDSEQLECSCFDNFTGKTCEIDMRPCSSNKCLNNAICYDLDMQDFFCNCSSIIYYGKRCEYMRDECLNRNKTCSNHGTCSYSTTLGDVQCKCFKSYMGHDCEIEMSEIKTIKIVVRTTWIITLIVLLSFILLIIYLDLFSFKRNKKSEKKSKKFTKFIYHN